MEFPIPEQILAGYYANFEDAYYSPGKYPKKFLDYKLVEAWFYAQVIFVQAQKEGESYEAAEVKVDGMINIKVGEMIKRLPKKPKEERSRLPKEDKSSKKK